MPADLSSLLAQLRSSRERYEQSAENGSKPPWAEKVLRSHYRARAAYVKALIANAPTLLAEVEKLEACRKSGALRAGINALMATVPRIGSAWANCGANGIWDCGEEVHQEQGGPHAAALLRLAATEET